jgi:tetraprenyl-beta-curcumene synthase
MALALANARYWPTVAPTVRAQLRRWELHAAAIPDPSLRELALAKLRDERFNAEVAATLATLSPRRHRAHAVAAIVALEVIYDYLDGLTERPARDPLSDRRRLYAALTDALDLDTDLNMAYYSGCSRPPDGGYLNRLANAVRLALAQLPSRSVVAASARASAQLCAEAQVQVHAAPQLGPGGLERWATAEAAGSALEWREFIAGAVASVLGVHALIALAAQPRVTPTQAAATSTTYLSVSAVSTMLDSLIDYERDVREGRPWLVEQYAGVDGLGDPLARVLRHAIAGARALPSGAHHVMTLTGVVAYYTSAPAARSDLVRPIVARVHRQLGALLAPTMVVMRGWRAAKQACQCWPPPSPKARGRRT